MEGPPEYPWRTTGTWHTLLGHLRPCSDIAKGAILLILSILLGWQSWQLDFIMAYPQVLAEMLLYMRLPQGYKRNGMTRKTHALKLICNVYSQEQAGRMWNKYMDKGM